MTKFRFHDGAKVDFRETFEWYYDESSSAAESFEQAVDAAVKVICDQPTRWPKVRGGFRYYILDRFPVSIYYRIASDEIEIVAVAHAKRKPGYGRRRNGHS